MTTIVVIMVAALLVPATVGGAAETGPVLVSRGDDGRIGNDHSGRPAISGDGRFIAFHSSSISLTRGIQNTVEDVFLHDRVLGTTTLVSRSVDGGAANGKSTHPSVSGDGRYVAYQSEATNLVAGDDNAATDIFVYDRVLGTTRLVSRSAAGELGNGGSEVPSISSSGTRVAFTSRASNLGPIDNNGFLDVYVVDLTSGEVFLASRSAAGGTGNGVSSQGVISGDGRYVAFRSRAKGIVPAFEGLQIYEVFRHDLVTRSTVVVSTDDAGRRLEVESHDPSISDDGGRVAFKSNALSGRSGSAIRVWTAAAGSAQIVSVTPAGLPTAHLVSAPSLSGDGRFVGFHTSAADVVADDTNAAEDVFVRDLAASRTVSLSQRSDGVAGDGRSRYIVLDRTGTYAAFESEATNFAPGDDNFRADVFVRDSIAASEPDVEGPLVASASVDPLVLDAAEVSRSVRITLRILDRSGALPPQVFLVNDAGLSSSLGTGSLQAGGSATDGTWEATVELPATLSTGVWQIRHLNIEDAVGNVTVAATLDEAPVLNVVDGSIDTGAPLIAIFGVAPDVVDGSIGGDVVVNMRIVDANGVVPPVIVLAPPSGTGPDPQTMTLESGTTFDGQWTARFTIPAGAIPGGWQVSILSMEDISGNAAPIGPPQGFDTIVTVTPDGSGTGGDTPPPVSPIAPIAPGSSGYWMLGETGNVHAFGSAPYQGAAIGFLNGPAAVDIEPLRSGTGYWVLDDGGRVHAFGAAAHHGDAANMVLPPGERPASLSATPDGTGYWVFTNRGRAVPFGQAQPYGDVSNLPLNGPVIDSVATPTGRGYYMVASDGGIFSFGDAEFRGSMGGVPLNKPVVGLAPTPSNLGYWLVASDGGVFSFGDASFRGSMGSTPLNRPVTGMVAYGVGYLLVAADGGIFSFSDRAFAGSLGANPPNYDIVSVAPLP